MPDENPRGLVAEALRLRDHARATGLPAAFEQAARLLQEAVRLTPAGARERPGLLNDLGALLTEQFERTGQAGLIGQAARAHEDALAALPPGHGSRPRHLVNLSRTLLAKFRATRDPADLDRAVEAAREATGLTAGRDQMRAPALGTLSVALRIRGELTASLADLEAAVAAAQRAIDTARHRDPRRHELVNALSLALLARSQRTGHRADADAAIEAAQAALGGARRPADRARILSNQCLAYGTRFELTRELADAAAAIDAARAAIAATAPDDPQYPDYLSNLGGPLRTRFEQVGELADIDEAIAAVREASARAATLPSAAVIEANLASLLADRFRATGALADVDEAVSRSRAAVRLAAAAGLTEHLPAVKTGLCGMLYTRHLRTQQAADLDDAIAAGRDAVQGLPGDHPLQAYAQNALSLAYGARYHRPPGDPADLTRAITAARAALAAASPGHPNRVGYRGNLGACLWVRSVATADARDLADAFAEWRAAVGTAAGPAGHRVRVAALFGSVAAENGAMAVAEEAYTRAVELLPLEAWHGLSQRARQEFLTSRAGLASDAAACAIAAGHPEHAVTLLEQGRSVLWNQALRLRGDLEQLRRAQPGLARRLDAARAILDPAADPDEAPAGPPAGRPQRDEARIAAADDWDRALAAVRAIPRFASFLQPPEFAQLTAGTGAGPVVIVNVSQFRCDALVVTPDGVRVVPLPELTQHAATQTAQRYRATLTAVMRSGWKNSAAEVIDGTLGWLWDVIAGPVLTALGFSAPPPGDGPWPRVWWCPTGPLTALPLHAAGRHQPAGDSPAVIDRAISSYAPTLRSLQRAHANAGPGRGAAPRMLLVTMATTPQPRAGDLPGAQQEEAAVTAAFPGSCTVRSGPAATGSVVRADLGRHALAHFSCHGVLDLARPEQSGLVLADGPLTIADLSRQELSGVYAPQLAYLSACSTGYVSAALPDEAITIAAGLQLAGFRHVIGTLWEISDRLAPAVAGDFYRGLTAAWPAPAADLPAARALHDAIRRLRADNPNPVLWASFFHTGP